MTKYYSFGGRRVAVNRGGTLSYLLADHLGSTTTTVNSSGALVYSQKYYPYGLTRGSATLGLTTDKQFTGHQQELGETYFMQSRFYDSFAGRFLQPDSIVPDPNNPQSLNRYSYVLGNPLRYTDPTGRCGISAAEAGLNNLLGLCGPGTARTLPAVATPLQSLQEMEAIDCEGQYCQSAKENARYEYGRSLQDLEFEARYGGHSGFHPEILWELSPGGDFCSLFTFNTTCHVSGGRDVGKVEYGINAIALIWGGLVDDASDYGRAARSLDDLAESSTRVRIIRNVTFGHGYKHLERLGVSPAAIHYTETSIAADVATKNLRPGFNGLSIDVAGATFQYNAYLLPDGTVNIGTYYIGPRKR